MSAAKLLIAAAGLSAAACGDDGRAAEIACQQRLIDPSAAAQVPAPAAVAGRRVAPGGSFAALSGDYDRMPLAGCTDAQRYQATRLASLSRDLDTTMRRLADVVGRSEREPGFGANEDFRRLQADLESFQQRREVLRRDLERMIAENR